MSDPRQLAEDALDSPADLTDPYALARALLAVLDDPFLRYRDKIVESLRYISTNAGSGDHGVEIADMATELLADLGVE